MSARDTNIPASRGRLLGREGDLALVRELVLHADGRLVTLTGAGGIGKTSLAFETARRVRREMADGVWLVDLEAVDEPDVVALRACEHLGLADQARRPDDVLADFLEPRQALLVVDECDRVLDATASLVDRLLDRCPDLRILVTGRTRLGIRGETVFVVPPIAIPDDERPDLARLASVASVQLFVERAKAARPGFALRRADAAAIATICRRLDGMPLAIELAAAQAAVLSPDEIAERLRGDENLTAAIDSSLRLLSDDNRRLFRRLAVFAGGWTVQAAEAICAMGAEPGAVTAGLVALVERSLVIREDSAGAGRFRMLAPIAEHAARLLAASGEQAQVALAHAGFYLALISGGTPQWQPDAYDRNRIVASEYENIMAAVRFAEVSRLEPLVVGFNIALFDFWGWRGWLHAAVRRLEAALAIVRGEPSPGRGYLLGGLALYVRLLGDHARAAGLARQAEAVFTQLGDPVGQRRSVGLQADIAADLGDYEIAMTLFERARPQPAETSTDLAIGMWHASVGDLHRGRGDVDAARQHLELARTHLSRTPTWLTGHAIVALAELDHEAGRLDEATVLLADALEHARRLDAQLSAISALQGLGRVAVTRRENRRAATLLAAATALRDTTGWRQTEDQHRRLAVDIDLLRVAMPAPAFDRAWGRGLELSLEAATEFAIRGVDAPEDDGIVEVDPLTPREREIAALVADGLTNPQIAERLAIAPGTVRIHVERILGKLGLTSRVQIATWVVRSETGSSTREAQPA